MVLTVFILLVIIAALVVAIFMNVSPQFGARGGGRVAERIQRSPNFRNGRFQNIEKTVITKKYRPSVFGFLVNGNKVPNWTIPVVRLDPDSFNERNDSHTRITWFGHSTVLLEIDGKRIFCDPMFSKTIGPHPLIGTRRFNEILPLPLDDVPELDAVIISHDHYDHLDFASIVKLRAKTRMFYVPLGVAPHLVSWGIEKDRIVELDWWEKADFEGITLVATPARHFSGRGLFDIYSTLWCSWVIKGRDANIFYGGDSGYDGTFKKTGETYGPFDFTMLECGQYDEQWPEVHMMPEETVQAHLDLKGRLLMPIHWGAFKIALHPWDEPVERLLKQAAELNVTVTMPMIGELVVLGYSEPKSRWWEKRTV